MVDFNKLRNNLPKRRAERQAERDRAAEDPGPALEATPVDGVKDWTKEIGVLYGTPAKLHDGWGITIRPTRQQDALIERRRLQYEETGAWDEGYMVGLPAVSIDKNGQVREVTIRDPSRGWRCDMYGNSEITCATEPRARDAAPELKAIRRGGDATIPTPPPRPADPVKGRMTPDRGAIPARG